MALQQAQLLLNMSSLEPVNFGVQQNNTEAFAVALCHLAELHAEQVCLTRSGRAGQRDGQDQVCPTAPPPVGLPLLQGLYSTVSEILQHLKEQFPPHSQHAKVCSPS